MLIESYICWCSHVSDDISVLEDRTRNAVCLLQLTRTNRNLGVGTNYKDRYTNTLTNT